MSLQVRDKLVNESSDGQTGSFTDITNAVSAANPNGYGSPNLAYSDIKAVRIRIASYTRIAAEETIGVGATLEQYTEYLKISGSAQTYDNKSIGVGNYIVPQVTGLTVASGDEFQVTGNYNPYISPASYLPLSTTPVLLLSSTDMGLGADEPIPNDIYPVQYEVYYNEQATPVAAVDEVSYIVTSGIVAYLGNQYRVGEVFIASGTTNITTVSGTGKVARLGSSSSQDFVLLWPLERDMAALAISAKTQYCDCYDSVMNELLKIKILTDGVKFSANNGLISYSKSNDIIQYCEEKIVQLQNSLC